MFRCQVSGKVSAPREKAYKIVTKTRNKTYTLTRFNQEEKTEFEVNFQGSEVVEELTVCEEVYTKMKGLST